MLSAYIKKKYLTCAHVVKGTYIILTKNRRLIIGELEDCVVGLPLLFGIITYLLIILSLTIWLTKYHACIYQSSNPKGKQGKRGNQDQVYSQPLNSEIGLPEENFQNNLPSGKKSLNERKEVFHQDK